MPTLVIRGPGGTVVERELEGRLTVGCDDDNDLVLRTGGVEKRHANFFAEGGEVVLEHGADASSAQTIVDGEPIRGRRRLAPGVRVVIGDYEVQVKPGRQLTVRKVEAPTPAAAPPSSFPFKLVFALFGVALAAILAVGVWMRLPTETDPPPLPPTTDPCADLEARLRLARERPSKKGLDAVEAVLECEPLHPEANALKRSIPKELDGEERLAGAKELIELERDAQALEQLEKIPAETHAALTALPLFREVAGRVAKQEKKDCDAYTKAGNRSAAQPHCDEAERLAKKLEPPKSGDEKQPSLAERLKARVPEQPLADALLLYAGGRLGEAQTKLQTVRENDRLAALHARADALRKDIANADALAKVGERALEKGDLERAAKAYSEALALDAALLPEGGSTLRKNAETSLAHRAYQLGAAEADHDNWVRACAMWKTGFAFWRGDLELNRAVTACSSRAKQLLASDRCRDLEQAAKLAVDGDTLGPSIEEKLAGLHCKR